ncbi:uncharacterized protein LAESUDRAFT_227319 [Laetiporus sulphureus 93-53]|uniref:Uncharacterized protein n=1 Tax=Laetiporus sulphureus 93-53 TaxID=1314785 RepID=A0A165DPX8_9APHY|nr:uncharacterized protein LAESUDRAFT_227319 [Laetiporus sulphureus 93-53]KZT05367.1 hypothetical protein LAESUDRAFT_227319 [Laetiporus sulphureus 93-53]
MVALTMSALDSRRTSEKSKRKRRQSVRFDKQADSNEVSDRRLAKGRPESLSRYTYHFIASSHQLTFLYRTDRSTIDNLLIEDLQEGSLDDGTDKPKFAPPIPSSSGTSDVIQCSFSSSVQPTDSTKDLLQSPRIPDAEHIRPNLKRSFDIPMERPGPSKKTCHDDDSDSLTGRIPYSAKGKGRAVEPIPIVSKSKDKGKVVDR